VRTAAEFRAVLFSRLADPRAIPILMRHAIPVIGVFVFDWSVLETVAALLLDAVSTLWMVGALGSYLAVKELDHGEPGLMSTLHFWAGVLGTFLVIAGLLTFMVAVPAAFFLPLVQSAGADPMTLVTSGWLPRAFAAMLAFQLPGLAGRIRAAQASGVAPEKMGMDTEVGFVVHRTALLSGMSSMLALFGPYALHVLVIAAQVLGAVSEIMRDHYVGMLMGGSRPSQSASTMAPRRRRKRR
jgi:hypothetical protein